jgi:ATP-dependent helicase/nuclease subunit B
MPYPHTLIPSPAAAPERSASRWLHWAQEIAQWAAAERIALRDAVWLVRDAPCQPLARRAFAAMAAWPPRIETIDSLARSLGPPEAAAPPALTLDAATDRLTAIGLLRGRVGGRGRSPTDPRLFDHAVSSLVHTAHALAQRAAAAHGHARSSWWTQARSLLGAADGIEGALALAALEWAATASPLRTDRVLALQPAAWIVLDDGAADPFIATLISQANGRGIRCLQLDARAPEARKPPHLDLATDFEDEAQRAAAAVIARLNDGAVPVALVAEDRLVVRRIRALLDRFGIPIRDETGWKLSTTRAGAAVMATLRAAHPRARLVDWVDWVKSLPLARWPDTAPYSALEQALLDERIPAFHEMRRVERLTAPQQEVLDDSLRWLGPLADAAQDNRPIALTDWLDVLALVLRESGAAAALQADAAGAEVLAALRTESALDAATPFAQAAQAATMRFDEFVAWADGILETEVFIPRGDPAAPVVIAPLRSLPLRPFAAAVFPGLDERVLAHLPQPHPLLSAAQIEALGLPWANEQRVHEQAALAHLLALPSVALLRRGAQADRPLCASPALAALERRWQQRGIVLGAESNPFQQQPVQPQPMEPPLPIAPRLLPDAISVGACEALRACPYRFFSRVMLGLFDIRESDDDADRRDYGSWLHETLERFHRRRSANCSIEQETQALIEIGEEVRGEAHFEIEAFLPFEAGFQPIARAYAQWLRERDAEGALWEEGEWEVETLPADWPLRLRGRIDRLDRLAKPAGAVQVLDYKTGAAQAVAERVRQPLEDTQLAAYAALALAGGKAAPGGVAAAYLRLNERKGVELVEHQNVARSAAVFVRGLGAELHRIQAGAALPALGDGPVCEHCEARGLCRRDHWPHQSAAQVMP